MIPMLILLSVLVFVIIKLPPGDFVTTFEKNLEAKGQRVDVETFIRMRREFGLDKSPV